MIQARIQEPPKESKEVTRDSEANPVYNPGAIQLWPQSLWIYSSLLSNRNILCYGKNTSPTSQHYTDPTPYKTPSPVQTISKPPRLDSSPKIWKLHK